MIGTEMHSWGTDAGEAYIILHQKDLIEIPIEITKDLTIIPVRWIDKVLELALERKPVPLVENVDVPAVAGAPAKVEAPTITKHWGRTKTTQFSLAQPPH